MRESTGPDDVSKPTGRSASEVAAVGVLQASPSGSFEPLKVRRSTL
jgi:hypothetical protein